MQWIIDNKEWLLSGLGIAIAAAIWKIFFGKKELSQKSGDQSTNIQAGGNVDVGGDVTSGESDGGQGK